MSAPHLVELFEGGGDGLGARLVHGEDLQCDQATPAVGSGHGMAWEGIGHWALGTGWRDRPSLSLSPSQVKSSQVDEDLTRPVEGATEAAQLAADVGAVLLLPAVHLDTWQGAGVV
jgi:hypothetical protein